MTLRDGDREYYYSQLDRLFPGLSKKYRETYGNAYDVISDKNKELMEMFNSVCKQNRIMYNIDECFKYTSEYVEESNQITLF